MFHVSIIHLEKNESISVASEIGMAKPKPKQNTGEICQNHLIHLFIYSFNKYIFSASYKSDSIPFPHEAYVCMCRKALNK